MISHKLGVFGFLAILSVGTVLATDGWIVRQSGVGPVKVGISLSQLNATLQEKFTLPQNKEDRACFYVTPKKHPGISFMIENGHLVRIDVDKAGVATAEGVQVGDSEEHAKQVYGAQLKIEPHHYTDGHYLTVGSKSAGYGIRFETENGKIETFYAGTFEAIQYVEGCQ
jgi:bacillopeptidase F (M6 metalloprotease family)